MPSTSVLTIVLNCHVTIQSLNCKSECKFIRTSIPNNGWVTLPTHTAVVITCGPDRRVRGCVFVRNVPFPVAPVTWTVSDVKETSVRKSDEIMLISGSVSMSRSRSNYVFKIWALTHKLSCLQKTAPSKAMREETNKPLFPWDCCVSASAAAGAADSALSRLWCVTRRSWPNWETPKAFTEFSWNVKTENTHSALQ